MAQVRSVAEVYKGVVNDVVEGVREAFLDEGLDDQILQELKQIWESKLKQSKALEGSNITEVSRMIPPPAHSHHQRIFQQHLIINPASTNTNIAATNQLQSLQAPILNLGASQLSQSAQAAAQSLPPTVIQHLNNISYLVPRAGNHRPILIQPQLTGASFIQAQPGGVIFGLSDQPIATSATPQNGVTLDSTGRNIVQLDGLVDSSSDEEENDDDAKQKEETEDAADGGEEVEDDPLNSDDDTSENDAQDLFDVDNVVVCQFDKINRSKAKWKFYLKDGIMNLGGRDYIFQKATGDAEF